MYSKILIILTVFLFTGCGDITLIENEHNKTVVPVVTETVVPVVTETVVPVVTETVVPVITETVVPVGKKYSTNLVQGEGVPVPPDFGLGF